MRALCLHGNSLNSCPQPLKMFTRPFIDSQDFAYNSREMRGKVPVAEMPRLQDILSAPEGEISYRVRGMHSKGGKPMLEVEMKGMCQLRCQRCLQALAYPVQLVSHLLLVPVEELDHVADDDENDSIPAHTRLDLVELLEEELLLSLPFSPKHPESACQPVMVGSAAEQIARAEASPFAVLAELKNK